jgi:hypothetical protein
MMNRKAKKNHKMAQRAAALRARDALMTYQCVLPRMYAGGGGPLTTSILAAMRRHCGMVKLRHYASRVVA